MIRSVIYLPVILALKVISTISSILHSKLSQTRLSHILKLLIQFLCTSLTLIYREVCMYVCMCLFGQLSLRHDNTRSSTKFGFEMLHKKLKKTFPAHFSSTFLSAIFHRSARGCFKSIQSYTTKKRMARVLRNFTKVVLSSGK